MATTADVSICLLVYVWLVGGCWFRVAGRLVEMLSGSLS